MALTDAGWRLSEPYSEAKQAAFVARMVKEIQAIPRAKIPPTTEQQPSTQRIIAAQALRDPKDDKAYWEAEKARPIPVEAIAVKDAKNIEEFINKTLFDPSEAAVVEDIRGKARNTVGQPLLSSIDAVSKDKAVQAFTYSRPADLSLEDKERVVALIGMESAPVPEEILQADSKTWTQKLRIDGFKWDWVAWTAASTAPLIYFILKWHI